MQLMDLRFSVRFRSDRSDTWTSNTMKRETVIFDCIDKNRHWLIPKFTFIVKRARLTLEQLVKIMMENSITKQKKEVFTEMLYNKKAILAWDFIEIGKVKRGIAPP